MVCLKRRFPRYPPLRIGEDSAVVGQILRSHKPVQVDAPQLYTYVIHATNTFDPRHFEDHWRAATRRWSGPQCEGEFNEMLRGLPQDVAEAIANEHRGKLAFDP